MRRRPPSELKALAIDYYRNRDTSSEYCIDQASYTDIVDLSDEELYTLFTTHRLSFESAIPQLLQSHWKDYVAFVRSRLGEGVSVEMPTHFRILEPYIRTYEEKFAPIVEEIRIPDEVSPYRLIGTGGQAKVYEYADDTGVYAIRTIDRRVHGQDMNRVLNELEALLRTADIASVPRIHAFSLREGVVVMDRMPGKEVETYLELPFVFPEEHLRQLIVDASELLDRGILFDTGNTKNVLYSDEGFSLIDFQYVDSAAQKERGAPHYEKAFQLANLLLSITEKDILGSHSNPREMAIAYFQGTYDVLTLVQEEVPEVFDTVYEQAHDVIKMLAQLGTSHMNYRQVRALIKKIQDLRN